MHKTMEISSYIKSRILERFSDGGRYFRGKYKPEGLAAVEKAHQEFPLRRAVNYTFYEPRKLQHYLLLKDRFDKVISGKILDVGSRDNTIQNVLKKDCVLVDKNNPALPPFDWEKEFLPFPDKSFDTVVCLDTLEHINDIHRSFQDLLRVSRGHVIISLPNCWRKTIKKFLRGYGSGASYGLPPEKPFDRHKWFFNTEDAVNFIAYNAAVSEHPYAVADVSYHIPKTILRHKILYPVLSWIIPEHYFKNLFTETIFVVLKKPDTKHG